MISLADAQRHVLEAVGPLPPRPTERGAALGLVLAEPVVAGENVPPFANSAVASETQDSAQTPPPPDKKNNQ